MGIFFTSGQPVVPEIESAIRVALLADPGAIVNVEHEAADRTRGLQQAISPQFNPMRFLGALIIAGALLWGAISSANHQMPDISRDLMDCFIGFSGIVLGLIGGEVQKL